MNEDELLLSRLWLLPAARGRDASLASSAPLALALALAAQSSSGSDDLLPADAAARARRAPPSSSTASPSWESSILDRKVERKSSRSSVWPPRSLDVKENLDESRDRDVDANVGDAPSSVPLLALLEGRRTSPLASPPPRPPLPSSSPPLVMEAPMPGLRSR